MAKAYNVPITGLPIFPLNNDTGRLENGGFTVYAGSGIRVPKDLEGRKLGFRSYTLNPTIWSRGVLRDHGGVDLDQIPYVVSDEEHVEQYHPLTPSNVTRIIGADLSAMLSRGEIDAGIRVMGEASSVEPAFVDLKIEAERAFRAAGVTALDHMVVVKTSLLEENRWLAGAIFEAFRDSKERWLEATPEAPSEDDLFFDVMPLGLDRVANSIEALVQLCVDMHILREPMSVRTLFPDDLN